MFQQTIPGPIDSRAAVQNAILTRFYFLDVPYLGYAGHNLIGLIGERQIHTYETKKLAAETRTHDPMRHKHYLEGLRKADLPE